MPVAHLDHRFSSSGADPVAWETVQQRLAEADLYWVVTVRADGRPHLTPLRAVVQDDVLHFCTGPTEQTFPAASGSRLDASTSGTGLERERGSFR